jgi:Spy/CpxP family protein refolding chaperone
MIKSWQVVLATIAIFVAGLVTGGATALGVVRWVAHHMRPNPAGAGPFLTHSGQPQQFGPQLMRSFADQLNLTDDQRAQIMPIVKRTASQLGRDRREIQLTSALAIEKMQDEIAAVLTPEQRAHFEDLISQQRSRLQQFRQAAPTPAPEPHDK